MKARAASPRLDPRTIAAIRRRLLTWYDAHRRDLPWRNTRDPYAIWVSEIMLQQTRVAAVIERYTAFLNRFPTVTSLAAAREEEVLALWSGLGYYRRARMLHRAAQVVMAEHGGVLPDSFEALCKLPGIGTYTAAAIASIAHGEPVAVVDGNVERVICRLKGLDAAAEPAGPLRRKVQALAGQLVDPKRPGDFNQAMMELGATACLPRNPQCLTCPLVGSCQTRGEHKTVQRKPMRSEQVGFALVLRPGKSGTQILLEQRSAEQTVMPGLWELPALREAEVPAAELAMTLRHAIMQVNYTVHVRSVVPKELARLAVRGGARRWVSLDDAAKMALTGLTRKVLGRVRLPGGR
jgi:A/G-specific adenine glycosylase